MDAIAAAEERIVSERLRQKLNEVNVAAQTQLAGIQDHIAFTLQQAYYRCAYECFDRRRNQEEIGRCVEHCSVPVHNAQNLFQNEMAKFQERLNRSLMVCQDKFESAKLQKNKSNATMELESCVDQSVHDSINVLPHLVDKLKASPNEVRSLWIGDLQYWMDESYLSTCFYHTGELVSAKVIRNKQSGQSEGYGFLEFRSHAAAETVLQTYNGALMPNVEQNFRMNWASLGAGERRDDSPEYTIFVGDLAADVTDYVLQETFKPVYSSVKGAKVVTDRITGRTKGYGFVKFSDESEQLRAMTEMNGVLCSSRPMRIGPAANKKPMGTPQKATYQNPQATQGESDPNNTTIFVGGLDPSVAEEHLRQVFSPYGELVHVKIVAGKRCGFVQFGSRASAEQALSSLNGTQLGGQSIRLSWGRSPSNKQSDQAQWGGSAGAGAGAYYGYAQGYEAYGYAPPAQDPNMYYGNYPGYGNYQQPQQ